MLQFLNAFDQLMQEFEDVKSTFPNYQTLFDDIIHLCDKPTLSINDQYLQFGLIENCDFKFYAAKTFVVHVTKTGHIDHPQMRQFLETTYLPNGSVVICQLSESLFETLAALVNFLKKLVLQLGLENNMPIFEDVESLKIR